MHGTQAMRAAVPLSRTRAVSRDRRTKALAEVQALAWLLDESIRVPFTGGRRFGLDALIGFVPGVGDLASGAIGLLVIWRAPRLGLPRIVVARMLANSALDFVVGLVPIAGDAFDLWFKANSRNLALMRRHVVEPGSSTANDWMVLASMLAIGVAIAALIGWAAVSLVSAFVGFLFP